MAVWIVRVLVGVLAVMLLGAMTLTVWRSEQRQSLLHRGYPALSFEIESELASFTVPVDVVGVNNEPERERVARYEVDKYFAAGDAMRKSCRKIEMRFTPADGGARRVLSSTDPIWNTWQEPSAVILFAQVPQYKGDRGTVDARRVVLPLEPGTWSANPIRIRVTRAGLQVLTPMRAK